MGKPESEISADAVKIEKLKAEKELLRLRWIEGLENNRTPSRPRFKKRVSK